MLCFPSLPSKKRLSVPKELLRRKLKVTKISTKNIVCVLATIDVCESEGRLRGPGRSVRRYRPSPSPCALCGPSFKVKVLSGLDGGNTVAIPSCGGGGTGIGSGNTGLVVCRRTAVGRRPRGWLSRSSCLCSESAKCASESCFMFMFRTRRTTLLKRLWKARVRRDNEARRQTQDEADYRDVDGHPTQTSATTSTEFLVRNYLLKRLEEQQLDALLQAVESHGANTTRCVLLRRDQDSDCDSDREPHLLCCQIWRWPELQQGSDLRRLPVCQAANDPLHMCCNPYHWSRLCKPESPPPPYCRFVDERIKPEDRAPSESQRDAVHRNGDASVWGASPLRGFHERPTLPSVSCSPPRSDLDPLVAPGRPPEWLGSLTTNGEGTPSPPEWCKLAYWEMALRVGRLYSVQMEAINVSSAAEPSGQGLCLATLAEHSPHLAEPAVQRTRAKIGLGVTLSKEEDGVWAYNRSENPIFVNSPTLDDPESRTLLVYRVPPGHCLNIFKTDTPATHWTRWQRNNEVAHTGPVDARAVRISFAKGWGPKYSRQEVTACPCWLEVLLQRPCR